MEQTPETSTPATEAHVTNSAIGLAIENYRGQLEQTNQSLTNLDAEYANRKTLGTNLANQLLGAIAALEALVAPIPDVTPVPDAPQPE